MNSNAKERKQDVSTMDLFRISDAVLLKGA